MTTNTLSKTDEIIVNYNMIPISSVDKMTVVEGEGKKVIQCILKEPESCTDRNETLTKYRRKRVRTISALGMFGMPCEVVFCLKYFNKPCSKGKQETIRAGCPEELFYTKKSTTRYARSVYMKVIELHRTNHNNVEITRHLKREHGVEISEGQIRKMLKFKDTDVEIPKLKIRKLGIDEFKLNGSNIIATALFDIDRGLTLEIVKGKKTKDIKKLVEKAEEKGINLGGVEVIARDLYKGWDTYLREKFPNAIIIVDAFHAVKRIQKQLYDNEFVPLRKSYLKDAEGLEEKLKQLKKRKISKKRIESAEEKAKTARSKSSHIFKSRFLWRTGRENIKTKRPSKDKPSDKERLDKLFSIDSHFEDTYNIKEKFRYIFKGGNVNEACQRLDAFKEACKDNYKPLYKTAINNEEYILNCFTDNGKIALNHYPEELVGELKRIQRVRSSFRIFDSWKITINILLEFAGVTEGLIQQHSLPYVVR